MKYLTLITIIIELVLFGQCGKKDMFSSLETFNSIVTTVEQRYHNPCTIFIYDNDTDLWLNKLIHFIKKSDTFVTAMPMSTNLIYYMEYYHRLPLYVFVSASFNVQQYLKQTEMSTLLSSGRWLLMLTEGISIEEFFADIYIPFDCEFLVAQQTNGIVEESLEMTLTEVYCVDRSKHLQMYRVANWSSINGLVWTTENFYERRRNLQNSSIKTALSKNVSQSANEMCKDNIPMIFCRIIVKLWRILEKTLNFTSEYLLPSNEIRSYKQQNGSWTGTVGMVAHDLAEVGIGRFAMTSERSTVVSFMSQAFESKIVTYVQKKQSLDSHWGYILQPFSSELWCVFVMAMLLQYVVLSATWYVSNALEKQQHADGFGLYNSWFLLLGVICLQSHYTTPRSWSSRLICLAACLTCLILFIAYSAIFISFLAVRRTVMPFDDFQGLLNLGSYRLGVLGVSVYLNFFDQATDPVMKEVYLKLIQPNIKTLPKSELEGFGLLCTEENYAFVFDTFEANMFRDEIPCNVNEVPNAFFWFSASFIINKNSPYKRIFNHFIQEMRRAGILKKIRNEIFSERTKNEKKKNDIVTMYDMKPEITVLSTGIVIAVFLLALEICFYKMSQKI